MSLPKSLLFNHSCTYAKRGGVAAYPIVWIGLCLRSVAGVRVLASAVDDMFYNKFIIGRYMFRALCAHHQEVKIVLYSIWYHHTL